ncbi:MAG: hypothetical protein MZU97_13690 [Bacillus subtilis]|nr:hypothetical protein [Bacillus subtilis]
MGLQPSELLDHRRASVRSVKRPSRLNVALERRQIRETPENRLFLAWKWASSNSSCACLPARPASTTPT